jgi:predicted CXXCH cytochrome family protein
MKRTIVTVVALAFVLLSAGAALAAISGSKHDMRTHLVVAAGSQYDEVCVYCHTPHGANQSQAQLWNRATPSTLGYVPYTSATMNATPGIPGAGSLICLSCHDGSIAVDSLVNQPTTAVPTDGPSAALGATKMIVSAALIGKDVSNDHPIGFNYNTSQAADAGLRLATAVTASGLRLIGGTQVECSSCHDAHSTTNFPFLRVSNQASTLCLSCHIK